MRASARKRASAMDTLRRANPEMNETVAYRTLTRESGTAGNQPSSGVVYL
jgi:hypothetical protein